MHKKDQATLKRSGRRYPSAVSVPTTHRYPGNSLIIIIITRIYRAPILRIKVHNTLQDAPLTSPKDWSVAAHVAGEWQTVTLVFPTDATGGMNERNKRKNPFAN
jgi:hypothetical protein